MLLFVMLTEAISAPDDSIERSTMRELSAFDEPSALAAPDDSPALVAVDARLSTDAMTTVIADRIFA